jgi:hypothetical protein
VDIDTFFVIKEFVKNLGGHNAVLLTKREPVMIIQQPYQKLRKEEL